MKFKTGIVVLFLCALVACVAIREESGLAKFQSFPEVCEATMNEAIQTVREKHFAVDTDPVRWEDLRVRYRNIVMQSRSAQELNETLNRMLGEVGHSHVALLMPEDKALVSYYNAMADGKPLPPLPRAESDDEIVIPEDDGLPKDPPGDVGMLLGNAAGKVYVVDVLDSSPAARAGIKPGDQLLSITTASAGSAKEIQMDFIGGLFAQMQFLPGRSGTACVVKILPADEDTPKRYRLTRQPDGLRWVKVGVMPLSSGFFFAKLDSEKIGYIAFAPCMPEQIFRTRMAIRQMASEGMRALVIDVRGNPGGLGDMAQAVCGMLVDTPMPIVRMIDRESSRTSMAHPQAGAFLGPVALLINSMSASSSEILAAGLQDNKRARLFGSNTGGQCLGSNFIELSTGFCLQTVFSDVRRMNGGDIEGVGVAPDKVVESTLSDLKKGRDTVIEKAKAYLRGELRRKRQ